MHKKAVLGTRVIFSIKNDYTRVLKQNLKDHEAEDSIQRWNETL